MNLIKEYKKELRTLKKSRKHLKKVIKNYDNEDYDKVLQSLDTLIIEFKEKLSDQIDLEFEWDINPHFV